MPDRYPGLCKTVTTTVGTGTYVVGTSNLSSAHRTPKQAVADGSLIDGDTVIYTAYDTTVTGDASFEWGAGVYNDVANTVTRATIFDGSNGPGVAVNWGSGQRDFYFTTAPDPARLGTANVFTQDQTIFLVGAQWTASSVVGSSHALIDTVDTGAVKKTSPSGGLARVDYDAIPSDGTSASRFRFFRNTSTVGPRTLTLYKGDGTSTVACDVDVATGNARFENIEDVLTGTPFEHFPGGGVTKMVFYQAAAPPGWTIDNTTVDDAALRFTRPGGVGSVGGTTTGTGTRNFSATVVGSTAISIAQMPAHDHPYEYLISTNYNVGAGNSAIAAIGFPLGGSPISAPVGSTGGGTAHDHALGLRFINVIVASKD